MNHHDDILAYYAAPAPMTALPSNLRARTPGTVAEAFQLVQGVLMHRYWAGAYGERLTPEREAGAQLRSAAEMADAVVAIDPAPLTEPRPPARRLIGVCRHFSVLAVALLRLHGHPARARCGFADYFDGTPVDHWVVEYWDGAAWKLGDAQLDAVQRGALKPSFDPLDVPRDRFLVAGEAWRRCRAGEADPAAFGIMHLRGLWFVAGNVVRDMAALNKVELLPWDVWGLAPQNDDALDQAGLALLDEAAALGRAPDADFERLQALYRASPALEVPERVLNVQTGALEAA
ncbi:MAG TPA: transglutaminase domain-containing protein [Caulobacteraceae bacterium]|nr:transglutaminase domain-containing protein [Caulobacteraceae bacterium]